MTARLPKVTSSALEAATDYLRDNDVQYVLAQFVDIHGVPKTKSVPVEYLETVVTEGAGFAAFAVSGLGTGPDGSDYMAVGDLSTIKVLPWMPGYARIVCDGFMDNKPYKLDSRAILNRQVARLAKNGLTLNTGLEPEFLLLKRNEDGTVAPADDTDTLDKPCYDYRGLARARPFLDELVKSLRKVDIAVYQIDHEDCNGMYEVNYRYSDAVSSADNFTLFKMAASQIAHEQNLICSFMPKPFANRAGTGMHMHMSIADKDGKNLFLDESDPQGLGLSKMAYHFLGGLLHHASALTALCCPSVNSYKRLAVGSSRSGATWAPAYVAYGDNNRSTLVRVPYGRLELRLPDGSCNPYLMTAAVIAAGLDGIANERGPGKPQLDNLYALSFEELDERGIRILPQTLKEALNELAKSALIRDALGSDFIDEFVRLKRQEWDEYHREITDWELNRYLSFY